VGINRISNPLCITLSSCISTATPNLPDAYQFADVNGDGLPDMIYLGKDSGSATQQYYVLNTGSGFGNGTIAFTTNTGSGGPNSSMYRFLDLNGDGRTDMIFLTDDGHQYVVLNDDGKFHGGGTTSVTNSGWGPASSYQFVDVNSDGLPDMIFFGSDNAQYVILNKGGNFGTGATFVSTTNGWGPASAYEFVDVDGDGQHDLVFLGSDLVQYFIKVPDKMPDLLTSVTSVSGGVTNIYYKTAAQIAGAISSSNSAYPNLSNASPRQLVSQVTQADGRGASYTTAYQYHNGRIQTGTIDQRKDLGFEWVQITKPGGQYTKVFYYQTDTDLAGKPSLVQEFENTGALASETSESYTKIYPYPGTVFPVVTQKQVRAYEGGVRVHNSSVTTALDGYGFPVQRTTIVSGITPIVEVLNLVHDTTNNLFGRVTDLEIHEGTATGLKLKHERNIYNGSGATCGQPTQLNLVCEKQVWLDKTNVGPENRFIATKYTYTIYGTTATVTDPLNRVTQYAYETDYQSFPAQITDPKGFRMAHVYDPKYGVRLSDTDLEDNVTISREYDLFGRTKKIRDANGTIVKEYIFVNEGNPNGQYIEVRTADDSVDGYHWFREFTDGMGRLYRKENKGFNMISSGNSTTTVIANDFTYDTAGRKATESNEYITPGGTPRVANFAYDARGRLLGVTYPEDRKDGSGKVSTSYAYGTAIVNSQLVAAIYVTEAAGNTKVVIKMRLAKSSESWIRWVR